MLESLIHNEKQRLTDLISLLKKEVSSEENKFLLEKDRTIILGIVEKASQLDCEDDEYEVLYSLLQLIPLKKNNDFFIGDERINPNLEKLIFSRREAREVEASLFLFPDYIQQQLFESSDIWLELTDRCTIACYFCGIADKGKISKKISFESATRLGIRALEQNDILRTYFATDPFDARWVGDGRLDLNLHDLIVAWDEVFKKKLLGVKKKVRVTTALPLGEELRVLSLIMDKYDGVFDLNVNIRISETFKNKHRLKNIRTILKKIGVGGFTVEERDSKDAGGVYRTNKSFLRADNILPNEVLGPVCGDYVVVSPSRVDSIYSVATTDVHPNGIERVPVRMGNGDEFCFPQRHMGIAGKFSGRDQIGYTLDPKVILLKRKNENFWEKIETHPLENNPHRAFLRILATAKANFTANSFSLPDTLAGWHSIESASSYERMSSVKFSLKDLSIVRSYLEDNRDRWMEKYLEWVLEVYKEESYWWVK